MNYTDLRKFASEQQMESDEMAIKLIEQQEIFGIISVTQSICDFNLAWLYSISPEVVIHESSLKFLHDNIKEFKRKLTIDEIMEYDSIINCYNPKNFKEFRECLSN